LSDGLAKLSDLEFAKARHAKDVEEFTRRSEPGHFTWDIRAVSFSPRIPLEKFPQLTKREVQRIGDLVTQERTGPGETCDMKFP
jgi:hypothetical protein